jgi:hypothetical protein
MRVLGRAGGLFHGYREANRAAAPLLAALAARVPGPPEADAFTRATLRYGDGKESYRRLLEEPELMLPPVVEPIPGPAMSSFVLDVMAELISTRRTGLLFAYPRVSLAGDYVAGVLAGMNDVDSSACVAAAAKLRGFEEHVRAEYGEPCASWSAILAIYEGDDERGLDRLRSLWVEHRTTLEEA